MNSDVDFVTSELNRFRSRSVVGRIILASAGLVQLFLAIPWLFGKSLFWSEQSASDLHLTRDGVIGLVFGSVAIAVARNLRLAWFALPLIILLSAVQVTFTIVDHRGSNVIFGFEIVHFLGVFIGVAVAVFCRPRRSYDSKERPLRLIKH